MRWCAYPDEVYYLKYAKTGIDIDFYLPSVGLAVQAAYSISGDAREREVGNLKKLAQTSQEAARLVIVTYEEEETIIEDGVTIETVPLYKFLLELEQGRNVYASTDCGKTITLRGHADIPGRSFDEHMLVEKKDGALWMLVRTFKGIGESFSTDGGYTWTPGRNSHIDGPCSRFFIRRLKSGRLLMINHYNFDQRIDLDDIMNQGNVKSWKGRSHLTAMLSEDDGETWPYTLLLDERNEVSYPDAKEADNGYIYVTYDWERVTQREILMARFTEDDILRGKILSPEGKLRVLVNKALGQPDIH